MSFSANLKNALVRVVENNPKRVHRLVCGVLQSSALLKSDRNEGAKLYISSESAPLLRLLKIYAKHLDSYSGVCKFEKPKKVKHKLRYTLRFSEAESFLKLHQIEVIDGELSLEIPPVIHEKIQRKKDYISGFFLGAGAMAEPKKSYHLEFLCKNEIQAKSLIALLSDVGVSSKCLSRSSSWVVYIKDSSNIADLISVMGALNERFQFEDVVVMKTIRNNVNRQVNCDTANLFKVADVSVRQMRAIRLIQDTIGLEALSDKLREAAELRIREPELTLTELGRMLDPPLGKSGVNHRLKKIENIAQGLLIEG